MYFSRTLEMSRERASVKPVLGRTAGCRARWAHGKNGPVPLVGSGIWFGNAAGDVAAADGPFAGRGDGRPRVPNPKPAGRVEVGGIFSFFF